MSMPRESSDRIARALRSASDERRWTPDAAAKTRLLDLERSLSIRIQAGQPELEAMNARMVDDAAADLLVRVVADMREGRVAMPTPCEMALFGRPPAPVLSVVSSTPLFDGLAQAA